MGASFSMHAWPAQELAPMGRSYTGLQSTNSNAT